MTSILARNAATATAHGFAGVLRSEAGRHSEPVFDKIISALESIQQTGTELSKEGRDALNEHQAAAMSLFKKDEYKKEFKALSSPHTPLTERIEIWKELKKERTGIFQAIFEGLNPHIEEGMTAGEAKLAELEGRINHLSPKPLRDIIRALQLIQNQIAEFTDEEKLTIFNAKRSFNSFAEDVQIEGTDAYNTLSEEQRQHVVNLHRALTHTSQWGEFKAQGGKIVAPKYEPTSEAYADFIFEITPLVEKLNTLRAELGGSIENAVHTIDITSTILTDRVVNLAARSMNQVIENQSQRLEGLNNLANLSLADMIAKVAISILLLPITLPIAILKRLFSCFSRSNTETQSAQMQNELTRANLTRLNAEIAAHRTSASIGSDSDYGSRQFDELSVTTHDIPA